MRKLRSSISPILLIAILALAIAIGSWSLQLSRGGQDTDSSLAPTDSSTLPDGVPQDFEKLFEVWATLKRDHLNRESLEPNDLSVGAVKGLLESLDDPYASYLSPEQQALESQDFTGYFEGIGAEVTMRNGRIIIVAPIPDTPAYRAGIRPGDTILEINGESTEGISLLEAVSKIRGPRGEPVELVIVHKTEGEPVHVTIFRDVVQMKSVVLRILVGGMAHLQITNFSETTDQEVVEALKKIKDYDARGIILDVRNNPGGLLDSVVDVTSHFIDPGLVLYEVDGRDNRRDWRAKSKGEASDIPLVLLVNEYSASGSEVLAGAFMDHQRATVIGVKTFGKGSVNTLRQLSDGSGIYFTIGRWYTPNGTPIEGEGLEPDLVVTQPEEGSEDLQLDKAIEVLKAQANSYEKGDGQLQDDNS